MTYIMSDLHGMYDLYIRMLKKIKFSSSDKLFILGDLCDRGPDSEKIYLDVMSRENVFCIKGNHEVMLINAFPETFDYLEAPKRDEGDKYDYSFWWDENGGNKTRQSFSKLSQQQINDIYRYISDLPYFYTVEVNGNQYNLVHAGLKNFSQTKLLEEYKPGDFLWGRPDFNRRYWAEENRFLVVGHTPTFVFSPQMEVSIFKSKENVIDVDCGAVYGLYNGRLGCLCLETMEEFYVK